MLDFEIGVYAVNEALTLSECIRSIDRASTGHRAGITVVLNGTRDNSLEILRALRLQHAGLRVFMLPFADKSNAINTFFYDLRRPAAVCVQIDGYVQISPGSLAAVRQALFRSEKINIVSTCQTTGRSAEAETRRTLAGGKCTGQFHAVRPSFVDRFVAAGLRLPLRLYWGDGLLGSMAAHDLDPIAKPWDDDRVIGIREAQFEIRPLSLWRWHDIQRQYRREIRQSIGRLQNEAIKAIIYQCGYSALPPDANDMAKDWLSAHRLQPRSLWERFKLAQALKQLDAPPLPSSKADLVFEA
ncbi:MAG TPA: glycosyltransferase family 2 protein [Acetobacteraceae bacterium]|nr:glycosyltransferase family 2 protein [Acetobacteraceae bacterium]